jgi:hypothetical protein
MTVELDLRAYAAAQIAAGHATLAAVPARSSTGRASRSCAARAVALCQGRADRAPPRLRPDPRRAPIRPRISPRPSTSCAAMPSTPCAT